MRGGVPHSAGQPVSSGRVARLSGVDFFHVNTIPRGTGVRFIRAFDNLARQKQAGKQNGVHSLSTWWAFPQTTPPKYTWQLKFGAK